MENGFENPRARGTLADMSTITVTLPKPLDAALAGRMHDTGVRSKEEYLLGLLGADRAAIGARHRADS